MKAFIKNLAQIGKVVSEKILFEFLYVFVEIDLPFPQKKIFKGFLPYMGMAAILII